MGMNIISDIRTLQYIYMYLYDRMVHREVSYGVTGLCEY